MEEKKHEIAKLQDQEKALYTGFQAALGENNKFASFLMKVLKKKIKRVKKKEVKGDGGMYFSVPISHEVLLKSVSCFIVLIVDYVIFFL